MVQLLCGVFWTLLILAGYVEPSYPSYTASPYPNPAFVPAMPGKTPKCVKDPRLTYCEHPYKYPKERIIYLLENKMFDVDTFLQDETRDIFTFEAREGAIIPIPYGKTPRRPHKSYLPSKPTSNYLPPLNNSYQEHRHRPSKFGAPHHLKPHPPVSSHSTNYYYSSNTTPSLNSFTSHPRKYDAPRHTFNGRSTPNYDDGGPYPRYPKNRYRTTTAPYQPQGQQQAWWKKSLKRERRQSTLSDLCPARANYVNPRAAPNVVDGDWKFLVNVDDRYTQLVKTETCIRNSCEGGCEVPTGFSATCQQQYVQKRLIALDGSGSTLNSELFWFPSCCICKFRANAG